ncbi:hypothetical protein Tco_0434874 [Tanacetum coccineum]
MVCLRLTSGAKICFATSSLYRHINHKSKRLDIVLVTKFVDGEQFVTEEIIKERNGWPNIEHRFTMDDPNITMEEYIRLEEEKARRQGRAFNWQSARPVNRVHVLDFVGLTDGMRQTLGDRLSMVYAGDDRQTLFTSHAWRRLFEVRAPLVREFMLEFFSTCRMSDTEMGLDVADTLCFQLGKARRRMTWRHFILALGLHSEEEMAEPGFGAYWSGCERVIPDKGDLRDYWMGEKVTRVDLFYLRTMDRETANVLYLLAEYLFRHAKGRKSGARLSGGHFIGRLAAHFGLVGDQGLRGLSVVVSELPVIDLHELARLNICARFGDTWAWVAPGPERQQAAAAGAPGAAEDAHADDESAQAVLAPVQVPQPPPPAPQPQTMSQRIDRLEEELGGARRRITWRQDILALGLHSEEEMAEPGFRAYWYGSERGEEKVIGFDLFYLRTMDYGTANVPYLLAQYLFRHAEGRKIGARLSEGHFIGRLASHFGLVGDQGLRETREFSKISYSGTLEQLKCSACSTMEVRPVPAPVQAPQSLLPAPQPRTMSQRIDRLEEEVRKL